MQINYLRAFVATFVFVLSFSIAGFAQASQNFPNVKIINFGKMDDRFYRGGQPEKSDYQSLKELGVNTIIDLRNDPTDYEKTEAEALGMKYVNIPMSGWRYPKTEDLAKFMEVMNDPGTGVTYVHCKAGKHRTGVAGAVYRFEKYGWNYDAAYLEMKQFNFTTWMVHRSLKTFVKDYYEEKMKSQQAKLETIPAAAQTVQ